jgi:hypothetical protein
MNKDSTTYGRIKRYCERALGIPSQCAQYAHVQKAQPQYISNVLMKFRKAKKRIWMDNTPHFGLDLDGASPG